MSKFNWVAITAVLCSLFRAVLQFVLGMAQQYVNAHPQIFGQHVEWTENVGWIADVASVMASIVVAYFSSRSAVKKVRRIQALETKLVNVGVEP